MNYLYKSCPQSIYDELTTFLKVPFTDEEVMEVAGNALKSGVFSSYRDVGSWIMDRLSNSHQGNIVEIELEKGVLGIEGYSLMMKHDLRNFHSQVKNQEIKELIESVESTKLKKILVLYFYKSRMLSFIRRVTWENSKETFVRSEKIIKGEKYVVFLDYTCNGTSYELQSKTLELTATEDSVDSLYNVKIKDLKPLIPCERTELLLANYAEKHGEDSVTLEVRGFFDRDTFLNSIERKVWVEEIDGYLKPFFLEEILKDAGIYR